MIPGPLLPLALRLGLTNRDTIDAAAIERLVSDGIVEDDSIDFKQVMYQTTEHGRNELAKDIAAFANHRGGVLVVGIEEANGVAVATHPFAGGDRTRRWVISVEASRVRPLVPGLHVDWVPTAPGAEDGYLLIGVPASTMAPHTAGDQSQHGLEFPIRAGSQTRFMSEGELASRYARRAQIGVDSRIAASRLLDEARPNLNPAAPWIWVALVPDAPGQTQWRGHPNRAVLEWHVQRRSMTVYGQEFMENPDVRIGHRRLTLGVFIGNDPSSIYYADLYNDGGSFVAREGHQPNDRRVTVPGSGELAHFFAVSDIVNSILTMLRFAATHAVDNAGTAGSAQLLVGINPGGDSSGIWPVVVGSWDPLTVATGSRALRSIPVAERVVSIDAVLLDPVEWMLTTKSVADELVQCFGLAEVPHISPEGELRTNRWGHAAAVARFAQTFKIPTAT